MIILSFKPLDMVAHYESSYLLSASSFQVLNERSASAAARICIQMLLHARVGFVYYITFVFVVKL